MKLNIFKVPAKHAGSLRHALAEKGLTATAELDQDGRRVGFYDDAQRLLGTARAALEYQKPDGLLEDLPQRMADLQRTCYQVSEAVTSRYFVGATAATWQEGM